METLLFCPSGCSGVAALERYSPLVTIPIMGACLLEYWMSHLAGTGHREVTVLTHDPPEVIEAIVGNGERWGLIARVTRVNLPATAEQTWESNGDLTILDRFPGGTEKSLFANYRSWFAGVTNWIPYAKTPDRVGMRELRPGVWAGHGARISPKAELHAPCWIGENAIVGRCSVIGPQTILEDGCLVEDHCEISQSHVSESSYISPYAELRQSIVAGGTLVNWANNSELPLLDPLLVSSLWGPRRTLNPPPRATDH